MTYITTPLNSYKSTGNSSTANIGGINTLNGAINNSTTTITLTSANEFPTSGTIKINNEYISYSGKSTNDLTGCTRGAFDSTAASHSDTDTVTGVYIGTSEHNNFPDVMTSTTFSVAGTIYYDFTNTNVEPVWSTFPVSGFTIVANIHEFHTAVKGFRYFRLRFVTSSTTQATSVDINTYYGAFRQGNLPLNQSIGDDSDSIVVRAVSTAKDPMNTYVNSRNTGFYSETSTPLVDTTIAIEEGTFALGDTTLTVTSATGLSVNDYIKIEDEYLLITAIATNDLTVTRGQLGTDDVSHDSGTSVYQVFNSGIIDTDGYTQFQIEFFSDVTGSIRNFGYDDSSGTNITRTFILPYLTINTLVPNSFPIPTRYFRFTYTSSSIAQSIFAFRIKMLNQPLSGQTLGVEDVVVAGMVSNLQRSVTAGKQPDGDYVNTPADGQAFATTSTLSGSGTYVSSWIDTDGWNSVELVIATDVVSANDGIQIDFTDDTTAGSPTVRVTKYFTFGQANVDIGFFVIRVPPILDGFRLTYTNGTSAQSSFYLAATLKINAANDSFNKGQALVVADFESEVALGNISNYQLQTKFGRNPDVDTGPEDIWQNGGTYTGMPSTSPETVDVFSSNANDTSAGTGARTIRIEGLKTSSSTVYETEDLTMNGTSSVTSSNTWWRINRALVLTAGSGEQNAGDITIRHTTTTANVFALIGTGFNQTLIAAYTVPAERVMLIKRIAVSITRTNGSSGSAFITLRARETGGVFRVISSYDVQTGQFVDDRRSGGIKLPAGTDVKFVCESVSDTNTIPNANIEFVLLTISS